MRSPRAGLARFGVTGLTIVCACVGMSSSARVSAVIQTQPGYRLLGGDGGVFAFGGARFGGSIAGQILAVPVVGIARNLLGPGYWLVATDGTVYPLGSAPSLGSMRGKHLSRPVFAIASGGVVT